MNKALPFLAVYGQITECPEKISQRAKPKV